MGQGVDALIPVATGGRLAHTLGGPLFTGDIPPPLGQVRKVLSAANEPAPAIS